MSPRGPSRQWLMPESAANPGGHTPRRIPTPAMPAALYDGHLSAECSLRYNGSPECPACLGLRLAGASEAM